MKEFDFIKLVVVVVVIVWILTAAILLRNTKGGEVEFAEYCQSKGGSVEDCKWEWKRLKNGQKSNSIIFMPSYIPRW